MGTQCTSHRAITVDSAKQRVRRQVKSNSESLWGGKIKMDKLLLPVREQEWTNHHLSKLWGLQHVWRKRRDYRAQNYRKPIMITYAHVCSFLLKKKTHLVHQIKFTPLFLNNFLIKNYQNLSSSASTFRTPLEPWKSDAVLRKAPTGPSHGTTPCHHWSLWGHLPEQGQLPDRCGRAGTWICLTSGRVETLWPLNSDSVDYWFWTWINVNS